MVYKVSFFSTTEIHGMHGLNKETLLIIKRRTMKDVTFAFLFVFELEFWISELFRISILKNESLQLYFEFPA